MVDLGNSFLIIIVDTIKWEEKCLAQDKISFHRLWEANGVAKWSKGNAAAGDGKNRGMENFVRCENRSKCVK